MTTRYRPLRGLCIGAFAGMPRFKGLGELALDQLASAPVPLLEVTGPAPLPLRRKASSSAPKAQDQRSPGQAPWVMERDDRSTLRGLRNQERCTRLSALNTLGIRFQGRCPLATMLVMIGDSVTDASRAQPVGEGLFEALGKGYVNLVAAHLGSTFPERRIRVVNMGCSGNTVRDLKGRWERDVLNLKPDWLAIMIGINDVWRQYDSPLQPEGHVLLPEYERTLDEIVRAVRPALKGLVLMTPYFIESSRTDAMRATMDRYGAVVKKLARKHGAVLVDTQAAFKAVLVHCHSAAIAWDRVHPNSTGHMILARAFLDAVGAL